MCFVCKLLICKVIEYVNMYLYHCMGVSLLFLFANSVIFVKHAWFYSTVNDQPGAEECQVTCWQVWTCWTQVLLINYKTYKPYLNCESLRNIILIKIDYFCHILLVSQRHWILYTVQTHSLLLETRYSLETLQVYISTKSSINSGDL